MQTGLLVLAEMIRRGLERDREIKTVAAAHAYRAIGTAHRSGGLRRKDGAATEQPVEEAALLAGARRRAVLRAAAVVGELDQQRLAARGALGGAALQLLELVLHAVEHVALLLDALVEPAALPRRIAEDRKEAAVAAADAARLRHQLVDLELLAVDGIVGALDLVGAGRVGIAAVERGELALQALASRIGRLRLR